MGAGASIEDVNAENERETCDKLFDRLNKTGGDSLNFMELKKGFEEIEKEEGIHVKMTAKQGLRTARTWLLPAFLSWNLMTQGALLMHSLFGHALTSYKLQLA